MRFTKLESSNTQQYYIDEDKIGESVQKLAIFENMCEEFAQDMAILSEKLEKLRSEGKDKTISYKELVAQKLKDTTVLMFFKKHGIEIDLKVVL